MALTEQDQQDLMYLIVGTFNAAPGRTIFNELADSVVTDGATLEDIAETLVSHPLFSDNSDGEYPVSQTNQQFSQEYLTELLGARGTWVEASAWDEANDEVVAFLNSGGTRAELVLAATQYLQNNPAPAFAAAADALANKVEVALFQAVELEQDASGSTLGSLRATIAGVDNTQASVDAAKDLVENGPVPGGTTFNLTAGTAAGADVMRLTGDQDVRIDFTDSSNQITGLDLDGDGTIERDGIENNQSGIAADFEIVDAYARNPLNVFDNVNNFLGDIFHDGTGVDGDGVSTDGNIVLGGLGSDTIFGGIGNDFLAGGGVSTSRFGYTDDSFDREADHLIGGRNADFFFVSLPLMNLTIDDFGSFSDGHALDIDGGVTADDNGPFGDTNQDSDWLLIEASDDDEPVEIDLWTDESQSITTRAGRFAAIKEIEHIDASGNLYGFLDDVDVTVGERAGKDTHVVGTENTAIGASAQLDIRGSEDDNIIIAGFDNDFVHGEDGDDLLFGGRLDYNNNPNLTGIVNDGIDTLLGGYGDDDIVFEADGGRIDGEENVDTLWLTELAFGTGDADGMTTDGTVRIDLASWQGYGGAPSTTWTHDQTNYTSGSSRVDIDNMENVIATGLGSVDYLAAGTNNPELVFNNQQNIGAIDAHLDLRGNSSNNWLIAAAGDDVVEGREGDDTISGGVGSDDYIFNLGDEYGSGGDGVDVVRRQTDANNDNIWDGGWEQDFGLGDQTTASNSSFTLGLPETLVAIVDGVTFELNGVMYTVDGLAAADFSTWLANLTSTVAGTAGLETVSVSSPAANVAVLTDAAGGTFVELSQGWILNSGTLPSDGLEDWYQEVGAPTIEMSQDRLIYQAYEDRVDGERVDDDSVLGSSISLGEDHYAEDLVVSFADDGTRIAEDQEYRLTFRNLTTEDMVSIEVNGVNYMLQVGVDVDGNIIDDEDTIHNTQDDIQEAFMERFAAFINSFMDDDTASGQLSATWSSLGDSVDALNISQANYNGEETVFMERPVVTIDQRSLGEPATVSISNNSESELHLLDFDGRDNNLNQENVFFWGDQEINRAALETAAEIGGTVTGSEAILIDGGSDDLEDAVQGSGASIFNNTTTNDDLITNFSVHGDDLLIGGGGDDVISGGTGDDRILGSMGDDSVDGGKNFYRVQVLGEDKARVYELNAYEAGSFSIAGEVITSIAAISQTEDGHGTVSGVYDDTLQFQQFDFMPGVTEFTITLNDYSVSGSGVVQLVDDGAGTVSVDVDGDGDFESVTDFTNFENVRTVSGIDKAVAGNGQGNDTLNVNAMSDDTEGVAVDMTNNATQGQVKHSADDVDIDPDDGDGTAGQNFGEYEVSVINVDGIENVISGNGDDLVLIDETEAAKNNSFTAGLGIDRIDYQNVFATNSLVAEPTATITVNTASDTDEVVMTAGRVGTTVATDTLSSVEVIGLSGNTAKSIREDDVLDVTAMTAGAVVDFVEDQVRDLAGNIQVRIEGMSELENVHADGDDVVIVSDGMFNSREDLTDGTPETDLQLFTFLDYDEGAAANADDMIDLTSPTAVRKAFTDLLPGDIDDALNQNQFTFSLSETGSGNDDDIVDYSAESGTIISVTDFEDGDEDHFVIVDHNGDLNLSGGGGEDDRVDHLIGVEGVVASAGESIIDLTNLDRDIELRYQKIDASPLQTTNVAMPNTKAVDLLFIDQGTNSAFSDFRYIEYYDDGTDPLNPGETALWNRVEGSDRDEKIEMTSDQLSSRHTFNLRGGNNEVNYNEQQSRGIEVSIDSIAGGITTLDIAGKDNAGVIVASNGNGLSDKVSSYNNTSTIAGNLRIEASQSEDDSINLASVITNNLFILGEAEGTDDVLEVIFDVDGDEVGLTLTGFESLIDSPNDDIYKLADITNILNTIQVVDDADPTLVITGDRDTLQLTDGALENFSGGNFGDGSIEVDDLEDSIDGADDGVENFDFSILDISLVTEQIDFAITLDTPTAVPPPSIASSETLILGDLGNFGDQGDANIDSQGFVTIEFTTTDGMGNNVVIDMDAGEFRQGDGDVLFTFDIATTFDFSAIDEEMQIEVVDTAMAGPIIIGGSADDTITGGGGDNTITGGPGEDNLDGGVVPEVLETHIFDLEGVTDSDPLGGVGLSNSAGDFIFFGSDGAIITNSGLGDQPAGTTALTISANADLLGSVLAANSAAIAAELSISTPAGDDVTSVTYDPTGTGGVVTVTYATGYNPVVADLEIYETGAVLDSTMEANLTPINGVTVDASEGSDQTDQMDSSDTFVYNSQSDSTTSAWDKIANFTIDGNLGAADDVIDLSALGLTGGSFLAVDAPVADLAAVVAAAEAANVDIYVGRDADNAYVIVDADEDFNIDGDDMAIELTGNMDITGLLFVDNFVV